MVVIRLQRKGRDFTIVDNGLLRDKELSLKAKGMLVLLMSLPDGWEFSIKGMQSLCAEGETAIRGTVKELLDARYCKLDCQRGADGQVEKWVYTFYEVRQPLCENPQVDNPQVENRGQLNTIKKRRTISNKYTTEDFVRDLGAIGVPEGLARDWMKVREKKKCAATRTAFEQTEKELERVQGVTNEELITYAVTRGWGGFMAEWYWNSKNKGNGNNNNESGDRIHLGEKSYGESTL